jgi:hypothetical protein
MLANITNRATITLGQWVVSRRLVTAGLVSNAPCSAGMILEKKKPRLLTYLISYELQFLHFALCITAPARRRNKSDACALWIGIWFRSAARTTGRPEHWRTHV